MLNSGFHNGVIRAKRLWFGERGEPIRYGNHQLRYVPGTRPVRLKYLDSPNTTVRNDAQQIQFFLDNIRSGDFVLDIGGHFGQYAVLFASLVSDAGRVITFEPDVGAQAILRKNLELNGYGDRVGIETVALFDTNGEHSFFSRGSDSMSSLARSGLGTNASQTDVAEYRVQTIGLDDYLAANKLGYPNFVKLDTEGAEINILKSGAGLLRSDAIIVCELHPYVWNEFGTSFEQLLKLISDAGRTIQYLDPSLDINEAASYGSVVLKRRC